MQFVVVLGAKQPDEIMHMLVDRNTMIHLLIKAEKSHSIIMFTLPCLKPCSSSDCAFETIG